MTVSHPPINPSTHVEEEHTVGYNETGPLENGLIRDGFGEGL